LTSGGAFHELAQRLLHEHERVLAHNGKLQTELVRLRTVAHDAAPPWEAFAYDYGDFGESDLPSFPGSSTGRPVLASERQADQVCVTIWESPVADACTQTTSEDEAEAETEVEEYNVLPKTLDSVYLKQPGALCLLDSTNVEAIKQEVSTNELPEIPVKMESEVEQERHSAFSSGTVGPVNEVPHINHLELGKPRHMRRAHTFLSQASVMSSSVRRTSTHGRALTKPMQALHLFLENSQSSAAASWYKKIMQLLMFCSVITPLLQILKRPLIYGLLGAVVESTFDVLFTIELLLRFIVSPAPRVFFCNIFNLIDLCTLAALTFRAIIGFEVASTAKDGEDGIDPSSIVLLCMVPILRLLRMLRRWEQMRLLSKAFIDVLEALPVLLFPLLMLTLVFAALLYIVEPSDNIPTLPAAIWLTIVTMTTVGYGDVTPESTEGSFIVSVLVITSVMYMAMPVAILGSSFMQVWQERDVVILLNRTRDNMATWGYTAEDVPALFQIFDKENNGALNIPQFVRMIKKLKFGLTDVQVFQLFRAFDVENTGHIDEKDFVRVLYPASYIQQYGMDEMAPDVELPARR